MDEDEIDALLDKAREEDSKVGALVGLSPVGPRGPSTRSQFPPGQKKNMIFGRNIPKYPPGRHIWPYMGLGA